MLSAVRLMDELFVSQMSCVTAFVASQQLHHCFGRQLEVSLRSSLGLRRPSSQSGKNEPRPQPRSVSFRQMKARGCHPDIV